ncbi:MAG: hypothetical protein KY476_12785 [Planctomycetes bacterium]|nr:hypothetical protein [Planctomycetota bacterium]
MCLVIGLAILFDPRRFRFDRAAGRIVAGLPPRRRTHRVDDVLAVQLVRHNEYPELNLVFDEPGFPRRNVCCHGDVLWTWSTARRLCEFLDVPLIDAFSDPKRPQTTLPREFGEGGPGLIEGAAELADRVDSSPLNVTRSSGRDRRLVRPHADCIELRPARGARLFVGGVLAFFSGAGGFLLAALFLGDWLAGEGPGLPGFFSVVAGVMVLVLYPWWRAGRRRTRFDKLARSVTFGSGDGQSRPLEDVVAIQVIPGPELRDSRGEGTWETWQLNIVFSDPSLPRLNLSANTDRDWILTTAHELAEFLKIPLLAGAAEV